MRFHLIAASASIVAGSVSPAAAQSIEALEPFVAEFRLAASGGRIEAMAWRQGQAILVTRETLRALGIESVALDHGDLVSLSDVPGLSFSFDAAAQAVVIACASACFARQTLSGDQADGLPVTRGEGAFLNLDLTATRQSETLDVAGAFELGVFGDHGYGGASWIAGAGERDRFIRLDTSWAFDFPQARTRLSLGDSIAHAGAGGGPFRFAGVQFGTDFSLDPTFVPFPTPTFAGDAAAPSVVDFYINGALRTRARVDPGPFEIIDAPVVAGGGLARVVVTDALGRQSVLETPFYASPNLLRPGLSDYAFAIGAERERYALESTRYGRGFALASLRRGLTHWATVSGRAELSDDFAGGGGGVSLSAPAVGQLDLALAASAGRGFQGGFASLGWARYGPQTAFAATIDVADENFRRLGQSEALPERRARATLGLSFGDFGRVSATAVWEHGRDDGRVRTFEIGYANELGRLGAVTVSALRVDDGRASTELRLTLSRAFGERRSGAVSLESRERGLTAVARMQSAPRGAHGAGWRAAFSQGDVERFDGGVSVHAERYDAQLELSASESDSAQRAQFSAGLALLDGGLHLARPLRESFAAVDVGAAGVDVFRDGEWMARTDRRGRAFLTGLRAYEPNRITLDVDDLPLHIAVQSDEMTVRPAARSGAALRFPIAIAGAGEVWLVDGFGAPLPEGAILVRRDDGARFAVGRRGRAFVDGVTVAALYVAEAPMPCQLEIDAAALSAGQPLMCRAT